MVNQSTEKKNTRQIQMTIEGHKVTISFAQEANPTLSALVRNTLLDAYIRKNGLWPPMVCEDVALSPTPAGQT